MTNKALITYQVDLARSANHLAVECRAMGLHGLAGHWVMRRDEHIRAARMEKHDDPCPIYGSAAISRFFK